MLKLVYLACVSLCAPIMPQLIADDVSFSRDVLPVLADRCFHCHGPDDSHRQADLRLDTETGAKADLGGYRAILPGNPDDSAIWQRITSEDPDVMMPPPDSHRTPLSDAERQAIRRWIEQGAQWGKHWAFEPPVRSAVPPVARHPIDAFVTDRLQQRGLQLSPRAAPHTQLRRLAFSLTGMAGTPDQVRQFADNPTDQAWQLAVDEMLQSPHHAERLAMWWLDAARYSDSDGFQADATRQNWPWRDWVIEAFHKNKPFDQFTIEQFAGDLLPDATPEQILATCFHRNHMTNGEGGRDPEESRVDYVIDRVNTTGTVWLGLTLGCTQCHSHKFDPVSHHDYYSMAAFFNSIDEDGKAGMAAKPYLKYTSSRAAQAVEECSQFVQLCQQQEAAERAAAETRFEQWLQRQADDFSQSSIYQPWSAAASVQPFSSVRTQLTVDSDQIITTSGPDVMHDDYRVQLQIPDGLSQISGWRIEIFPHDSHVAGRYTRYGTGDFTLTSVKLLGQRGNSPSETELPLAGAKADFEPPKDRKSSWDTRYANIAETLNDDARDGWTSEGADRSQPRIGVYELATPWKVRPGDRLIVVLQQRSTHGHASIGRFRISLATEPGETIRRTDGGSPLSDYLKLIGNSQISASSQVSVPDASVADASVADASVPAPDLVQADGSQSTGMLPAELRRRLLDQYLLSDAVYQACSQRLTLAQKQLKEVSSQIQPRSVMVLQQRAEPRKTYVLERGVWDAHGDLVTPGVISSVLDWSHKDLTSRMDLARWIVASENPLTARVIVNQLWQVMFGTGLVRTPDDFGLQGQLPTHPELLDWLAVEFIESGWDVRHILRLIATSETFRQSSATSIELRVKDPDNRLLARAPRRRLQAWMLRDNALQISGLLNNHVGGPPVFPYQPAGVWSEITMGRFDYQPSLGPAQYRRTIYAFWRRSIAPTFLFDSAQRRVCETGVRLTNTPLQALTLMNDQTMLEASRALADLAQKADITASQNSASSQDDTIQTLARRVLGRALEADELAEVSHVYQRAIHRYRQNPDAAAEFLSVGQRPSVARSELADIAAWMTVSGLLLNLDEAISFE